MSLRFIKLFLAFAVCSVWTSFVVLKHNQFSSLVAADFIPQVPQAYAQTGGSCSIIGNNAAVQFHNPRLASMYPEAQYTLALYDGAASVSHIINAVNSTSNTVIVRLGAGLGTGPKDPGVYAADLNTIAAAVGGKSFIAMASHNEPNCAEYELTRVEERAFAVAVTTGTTASNVKFITGQIDYYCGASKDGSAAQWAQDLLSVPKVEGLALPYYTGVSGNNADATLAAYQAFVAQVPNPGVYITESGPYEGEFSEFANAVAKLFASPGNLKAFLLFNAFGHNPDPNFTYTKPFWSKACREAFRKYCTDAEKVIEICGKGFDPDDYYIYPIAGIKEGSRDAIADNLIDQGYQVSCTVPTQTINSKIGGLFEYAPPAGVTVGVASNEKIDYSKAGYPLFRNPGTSGTFSSLEGFWGYKETSKETPSENLLYSSTLFSRLTDAQQCRYQVNLLRVIKTMCEKLENPENCALYQAIPDTIKVGKEDEVDVLGYTTHPDSLLAAYEANFNPGGNDAVGCSRVLGDGRTDEQLKIRKALNNVPLYLDKAYRLAFLVMTAETQEKTPGGIFSFLLRGKGDATPRHEVRVLAFKIPDIATNKDFNSDIYYDDPAVITKKLEQTQAQQKKEIEKEMQRRGQLKLDWRAYVSEKPPILCADDQCGGPTVQALVKLVNGTVGTGTHSGANCTPSPERLNSEPTDTIKAPVDIAASETRALKNETGAYDQIQVLEEQGIDNVIGKTPESDNNTEGFYFMSDVLIAPEPPAGDSETKIYSYLVYPVGYELETIQDTMIGVFFTDKDASALKILKDKFTDPDSPGEVDPNIKEFKFNNQDIPNYLQLIDIETVFTSARPQIDVNAPDDHECRGTIGGTQGPGCTAEAYLEMQPKEDTAPRVLGAFYGFITRTIQQVLSTYGSPAYNYVVSCKTTEDFILGRCSGKPAEDVVTDDGTFPQACAEKYDKVVTVPSSMEQLKTIIRKVSDAKIASLGGESAVGAKFASDLPLLMWGIFRVEGGKYRDLIGQKLTINCLEMINDCGAVGPMQAIDGSCVKDTCNRSPEVIAELRKLIKNRDLCSIEGAMEFVADKVANDWQYLKSEGVTETQLPFAVAGRYLGLSLDVLKSPECTGPAECKVATNKPPMCAKPIDGCNGMNYCQCAYKGFDSEW